MGDQTARSAVGGSMVGDIFAEHLRLAKVVVETLGEPIERAAQLLVTALTRGNKILLCGNGGSAADCQHMAAELVGRFETERCALPAVALTTDSSSLTALGNDLGFVQIFARQVHALAQPGDLLWAFSTSGRSPNILAACAAAAERDCRILAFCGQAGNPLGELADVAVEIPSISTARTQEMHILIGHILCAVVDRHWGA